MILIILSNFGLELRFFSFRKIPLQKDFGLLERWKDIHGPQITPQRPDTP